ncbi:MAG: Serine/threonine kinase, partial [Deltaproteobacteria bacterium]|nr:Serine/threonine kinase [Deltaproteobacteria bacterium]
MTECLGENTVTDLVEALLAPARRVAVEAHAARCEPCRRLISELVRRSHEVAQGTPQAGLSTQGSFDPWFAEDRTGAIGIGPTGIEARGRDRTIAPGTRVGRYVVRDQLGSGAMGAVFAAYDPELDRAIALKLLHPGSTTQRARIRREARALARLSHPNVVAAYDVGEHDGDLFLAMELVDGMSLRAWVKPQRSTADVLDVFRQAGRGLAAAHAAGLVHRDFKPDNAVVGNDGRVRVVDFGLAAGPDGGTALVGTPAYMAPEQFEAGGADAASDQFAFCVALHEALFGDRPFAVNLVEDVARGLGNGPPKPREVPAFVLVALARGLEVQPANRHPSMDALLAELSRDPGKLRTRVVVGGAVVVASLIAGGLVMSGRAGPPLCQDSTTVFARVWSPAREADLHARFTAVSAPFGEDAWRAVERGIAGFGARWVAARTESCEATRVRGVQSDQIFSLRSLCLDHGLGELDALATLLESVDPASIAQAPAAIDRLPSLAECANLKALLAPVPLPVDKDAAAVAAVNQQLARGRALRDAARWAEARSLATTAVEVTRTIGHSPTHGAALFLRGEAEEGSGDARQAEASLREAFAAAEAGSDDLLAARAAAELVFVVGQMQNRTANGLDWAFHADTALKRAGGDLEIEARIAGNRATLRAAQDNFAEARVLYQRALDLRIKTTGPTSVTTARALFNLGYAVMAQGDNAHALELDTRALHLIEAAL